MTTNDVPSQPIRQMVRVLRWYGIADVPVLDAMARVPRHLFIPAGHRYDFDPYGDHPCPIGHGQTISQPFIVAHMTVLLSVSPGMRVLEVGTGCGYQAAVLLELGAAVRGLELVPELAEHAAGTLSSLGYSGFSVAAGDGYRGWPEGGPFDRIMVSCAPERVPEALLQQLSDKGRMVLPLGPMNSQRLVVIRKSGEGTSMTEDIPVRFVPMVPGRRAEGQR